MRKVLFVLVMLLTVGILYAATSVQIPNDGDETTATLKISLPLETGSEGGYSSIRVGFSSEAVSDVTATPKDISSEPMALTISGDKASLDSGLFAYWQMVTPNNVTVSMYLSDALKGDASSVGIDWMVTAPDATDSDKDVGTLLAEETATAYGKNHSITLVSLTPVAGAPNKIQTEADSTPLTIQTASFAGKTVDDYSANIVLSVEVK